jgi:allantoin racemase
MSARIRLLIVNPNTSVSVTRWLAEEAKRVAGGRAEIAAVNAPSGLSAIQTPDDLLQAAKVIVGTIEADAAADVAIIIAAFGDPGLTEARARLSIPVVGLGEAGLGAAANGRRFSIVTLGEAMRAALVERVRSLGLEDRLAEIRILPVAIPEMIANREANLGALVDAIRAWAEDAVLLGGAPLAGLGVKMAKETGLTVLDGVEASVTAALQISGRGS